MSGEKLKLLQTETDNLISNLRGEIGEIITTWIMMRYLVKEGSRLFSGDITKLFENEQFAFLNLLEDKLRDELVARLSEIAENKIGRLNFHFASQKLDRFQSEADAFSRFVAKRRLKEKRNRDVSHKNLPEKWSEHSMLSIQDRTICRAIGMALRFMKRIDEHQHGPLAKYLWRAARKRRYNFTLPPQVAYMLIPYLPVLPEDRERILKEIDE